MRRCGPLNWDNDRVYLSISLLVIALAQGGCSTKPLIVAVPEKSKVARLPIEKPNWQDFAMCALKLRTPCKDLLVPQTLRSPQEIDDFKRFLDAVDKYRQLTEFQQKVKDLPFVEKTADRVVDAMQEDPASPASPTAYKVHDCWVVLYAVDDVGFSAMQLTKAKINQVSIFCHREATGPGR